MKSHWYILITLSVYVTWFSYIHLGALIGEHGWPFRCSSRGVSMRQMRQIHPNLARRVWETICFMMLHVCPHLTHVFGVKVLDLFLHVINGNFRILNWRYVSTICLAIFCGDIHLHRPYIGLIYGRYLHFRILKFPLMWFPIYPKFSRRLRPFSWTGWIQWDQRGKIMTTRDG